MKTIFALLIYVYATGAQYQIPIGSEVECHKMDIQITMWKVASHRGNWFYSTCHPVPRRVKL